MISGSGTASELGPKLPLLSKYPEKIGSSTTLLSTTYGRTVILESARSGGNESKGGLVGAGKLRGDANAQK